MRRIKGVYSVITALAVINAMFFFSMRHFWSGVYDLVGIHIFPVLVMALLTVIGVSAGLFRKNDTARLIVSVLTVIFTAALIYMFTEAFFGWMFILREFIRLALYMALAAVITLLLLRLTALQKGVVYGLSAILSVVIFCFAYGIQPGGFAEGPAVFAVGSDYQIVFTTRADSLVRVECGGNAYYDTYNGSARSGKVHKVIVPMSVLDSAKSYEIHAQTMIMRGPYDAIQGGKYSSRLFNFSPVSEFPQFYAISDTHDFVRTPVKTASYYLKESELTISNWVFEINELDCLVLLGDHASFITGEEDLTRALKIAYNVTGGNIPVVYARGNHEVKAKYADRLDRYTGADEGKFYYTFRLGSVWGVVLDVGEDHADDWWEFYGTAHFDDYRDKQLEFLRSIDEEEYNAPGIDTKVAICHIPITKIEENDYAESFKRGAIDELNRIGIDFMLNGHTHKPGVIMPDELNGAEFPAFVVSRQSNSIDGKESAMGREHIGLAINMRVPGLTNFRYTNSGHEVIEQYMRSFDDVQRIYN